ncbi:hypothetical protein [Lacticaseibacillus paracasei]|uniref:Integral membrane protein n=1 Tax=Lacticaseibacillus paracasei subsp. paracasei Lpp49 TaxID=1256213 RepID=A0ABC9TG09_LACPA|nr:hypothetical protein [Lacticaseibacillus paracasei]EPC92657.1 hypothetical protein Lpp49_00390 [Lacticaseibacillus paracasei subsp. paracasei Lpp49]
MPLPKKNYDIHTINVIVVSSSFILSVFLMTQNFQNIFTLSMPLSLSTSSKQVLTTIQTAYFPPVIIIFVRVFLRKVYPTSIGYTISLVVTILEVILTSILILILQLSQSEFSPVSVLQNAWAAPIVQLISLLLLGGSFIATLITLIDYRKRRSA